MAKYLQFFVVLALLNGGPGFVAAAEIVDHDAMLMDHGGGHLMDMGGGMVMGQNVDALPGSCDEISEDVEITVHAGHKYAKPFPGRMFAFDEQEWRIRPCTRLTIHFVNEDNVRHQWMMHGLPKYLYKSGMFHLEVTGPGKISGTIILPANDQTYLVHCDIAQHMEKGMKAQLVVGKGGDDLPSIPGLTPFAFPDSYEGLEEQKAVAAAPQQPQAIEKATPAAPRAEVSGSLISGMLVIGLAFGLLAAPFLANYFKGMTAAEIASRIYELARTLVTRGLQWLNWLIQLLYSQTKKYLPGK
jgi:plastocyanin